MRGSLCWTSPTRIGTDSGSAWTWWIYVGATVAVAFLFAYRITMSAGSRRSRQGEAPSRPTALARPTAPARPSAVTLPQVGLE